MTKIYLFIFALTFVIFTSSCGFETEPQQQFTVISTGSKFDNAIGADTLPLSFHGLVFQNKNDYQHFLQDRANLPSYGLDQGSKYEHIIDTVDTQKYLLIMIMQEGMINVQSTIEPVRVEEVRVIDNILEVYIYLPEPTEPPCERENILTWILGGQVCNPMGIHTNTFEIVAISRDNIPPTTSSIVFISQQGTLEDVYIFSKK